MARYDFVEVVPADPEVVGPEGGFWAVVEGNDGMHDIIDDCFDTAEEAEQAGRSFRREIETADAQQQRDAAVQAGMAMGCDAYNDFMGY